MAGIGGVAEGRVEERNYPGLLELRDSHQFHQVCNITYEYTAYTKLNGINFTKYSSFAFLGITG